MRIGMKLAILMAAIAVGGAVVGADPWLVMAALGGAAVFAVISGFNSEVQDEFSES